MFSEFKSFFEKFLTSAYGAEDLSPYLLGGLGFPRDFVGPFMGHVTIGTGSTHTGPIGVMDSGFQFLVDIVTHFVTADAKCFGVGGLQSGVKTAPENDSGDETTDS
jgi:hypothetical protein